MQVDRQWYYAKGGEPAGPVSEERIIALLTSGSIGRETLLWSEGMDDWVPAEELIQAEASPPAPPGTGTIQEPEPGASREILLPDRVVMMFRYCPAGQFLMGSPIGELGRKEKDETQHPVVLTRGFWMAETPVTQAQWRAVTGGNPSHFQRMDLPVESVSWEEANEFCGRLSRMNLLGGGWRLSLPTEAQWEYACRAGTKTALNNGKDLTLDHGACRNLDQIAWYHENSGGATHPVKGKTPNAWGLYDMHGNVLEWCQDWYDYYPAETITDPIGCDPTTWGSQRVLRGGGGDSIPSLCRSARREFCKPSEKSPWISLRVAAAPLIQ